MTPDELKKLKGDKVIAKIVAPKALDLSKAERIFITKEELKQRELMEQEKLKDIWWSNLLFNWHVHTHILQTI